MEAQEGDGVGLSTNHFGETQMINHRSLILRGKTQYYRKKLETKLRIRRNRKMEERICFSTLLGVAIIGVSVVCSYFAPSQNTFFPLRIKEENMCMCGWG